MSFPFLKIFTQAAALIKTSKFLWGLGLFLVWGTITANYGSLILQWPNISLTLNPAKLRAGMVVVSILIALIFFILYFRAKAAMIIAVRALLKRQETGFVKSLKTASAFYVRIMGSALVLSLSLLITILILGLPIFYLSNQGLNERALMLGILAMLIYLPISVMIGFLSTLAPMFIVFYDMKLAESLSASLSMSLKHWKVLLILMVLLMVILSGIFMATASLVFLAVLFYDKILAVAVLFFFAIQAVAVAFANACWVLAFQELIKPVKLEEEGKASEVPEIARG